MRVPAVARALVLVLAGAAEGCSLGCPTGLAEGVFVADDGELALRDRDGLVHGVRLPSGYRVEAGADGLVLVDFFGTVKARQGEFIQFGGGGLEDGRIAACEFVGVVPD